ncbi:MAG: hypothetical protein GX312_00510, partial [Candidatus Phytoplasma sp.]|nr:hypothetical protein [Phytoplasma sp.]
MKHKRNVQTSLVFVFLLIVSIFLLLQTRSFITSYTHKKLDDQTVLDASSGGYFGGLGTEDNPYIISKADDMVYLSHSVNAGETYKDKYFSVVASIGTIALKNFTPIGTSINPFEGNFNGNGVTIDLNISNESLDNQALFGYIKGSTITNLSVKGSVIGKNFVGALVGYMNGGTISHIYNKTTVNGNNYVGGLIGYKLSGVVQNVYNQASIKGVSEVGGIVGRNQGG